MKLTEILFYVDSVCWSLERPRVVNGCSLYLFLSSEFLFAMASDNAAAVQRELEDMREAMKGLAEQAVESKKQARKVMLDKAVASVKQAASRRSVRYTDSVCWLFEHNFFR